jgi:hypothetical protein
VKRLERSVERRFTQLLDDRGLEHVKFTPWSRTGRPDRLVLLPGGRPVFVELKRPGEVPRPKQDYEISKLRQLGYQVIVEDDADRAFLLVLQHGGLTRE